MSSIATSRVTPEEYLERERKAELRHEYRDGEIVERAPSNWRHALIATHILGELGQRLHDTPCNVYGSLLRVAAPLARLCAYPDASVTLGDDQCLDEEQDTLLNPVILFEVLSEATERYDRGKKFQSYRTLESLRDYVLVAQDKIHVEHWTRQPNDEWIKTDFRNLEDTIKLSSIDVELPLSEIYLKVDFPA